MSNNMKSVFEKLGLLDQGDSSTNDAFSFKKRKDDNDLLNADDANDFGESLLGQQNDEKLDLFATANQDKNRDKRDEIDDLFSDDSDEMDLFFGAEDQDDIFVDDSLETKDDKDMFADLGSDNGNKAEAAAEENFIFAEENLVARSEVADTEVDDLLSGLDKDDDLVFENAEDKSEVNFEDLFAVDSNLIKEEAVAEDRAKDSATSEFETEESNAEFVEPIVESTIETEQIEPEDELVKEVETDKAETEMERLIEQQTEGLYPSNSQSDNSKEEKTEDVLPETSVETSATETLFSETEVEFNDNLSAIETEAVEEVDLNSSLFQSTKDLAVDEDLQQEPATIDNSVIDFIQMPTEMEEDEAEIGDDSISQDISIEQTIDLINMADSQTEEKTDSFYQIDENNRYDNFEAISDFDGVSANTESELQASSEANISRQSKVDERPRLEIEQTLEVEKMDNSNQKSKFALNQSNVLLNFLEENEETKQKEQTIDFIDSDLSLGDLNQTLNQDIDQEFNLDLNKDLNIDFNQESSQDFSDYPDFSGEELRENSYVDVERKIDRIIESFDRNKLFSVEDIYKKALLNKDIKSSIFMVEIYSKALPDNLPIDVKRESVVNIMKAADLEVDGMLEDAYLRIDALNRVQENVVKVTTELKEKNEKSIADLEKRIKELKRNTQEREIFQNKQNTIIEYEMQRIINILDFIKHK